VHRVGPVGLRQRRGDEQHKGDIAAGLAGCPTHRHSAEYGGRQRVGEQGGQERMQRVVGLRRAVRVGLDGTLAEAVGYRYRPGGGRADRRTSAAIFTSQSGGWWGRQGEGDGPDEHGTCV